MERKDFNANTTHGPRYVFYCDPMFYNVWLFTNKLVNVNQTRESWPQITMRKSTLHLKQLFMTRYFACVCVCVCVCERERERENQNNWANRDRKFEFRKKTTIG